MAPAPEPPPPEPAAPDGFPGEQSRHHMRKLAASNPAVTCASCRQFDGTAWCRRWNYHTAPDAPVCAQYRPRGLRTPPAVPS
jgi:hypothetical protein